MLRLLATSPCFWIADIIEVDAVNIIAVGNLFTHIGNILSGDRRLWIHVFLLSNMHDEVAIALAQLLASVGLPLANGNGHHPSMKLHTSTMTFVDSKL